MRPGRATLGLCVIVAALGITGCGRFAATPAASATEVPIPSLAATSGSSPAPAASDATPAASSVAIDLEALRAALLGPSPVPSGWEAEVDEIVSMLEGGLASITLPDVAGLPADEAACATWEPMVGHVGWATGALLERQFTLAHLSQLASVAPDEIASPATEALRVASTAAAAQLSPDGDPDVISTAPREEIQQIGLWALAHCRLEVVADEAPDTEDWTEDDIAYSCELDRDLLVRAQEEFRDGPGAGRLATHPHELEVTLDAFVFPAWHRIAAVDNAATPPTGEVEPIPGSFCDR